MRQKVSLLNRRREIHFVRVYRNEEVSSDIRYGTSAVNSTLLLGVNTSDGTFRPVKDDDVTRPKNLRHLLTSDDSWQALLTFHSVIYFKNNSVVFFKEQIM